MKSDIVNSSPVARVNYTLLNNAIRTGITVGAADFGIWQWQQTNTSVTTVNLERQLPVCCSLRRDAARGEACLSTRRHRRASGINMWWRGSFSYCQNHSLYCTDAELFNLSWILLETQTNDLGASLLLENSSCAATVPSISLGLISLVQSPSASLV